MARTRVGTTRQRLRILVLGYIVRFPLGGMTWHYLQYVLGLMELGHDVYFLEDSDDFDTCCYNPVTYINSTDPTYGLSYAQSLFERVGVGSRWAYYDSHTDTWMGPGSGHVKEFASSADILINVSGSNVLRQWLMRVPVRVMIDTDPAFEQVRQLTVPSRRELAGRHTHCHETLAGSSSTGRGEIHDGHAMGQLSFPGLPRAALRNEI